jgi:signal transduction histidine kinase
VRADAPATRVRRRYRPSVRTVLIGVAIAVLALSLTSFAFFRFYDNQLVRETEAELIPQAAVLSAVFKRAVIRDVPDSQNHGVKLDIAAAPPPGERYLPVSPHLDIFAADILPPRPPAQATSTPPEEAMLTIGKELYEVFVNSQSTTLAGFRVLDARGVVIGGREETGSSLAHVEEVREALAGSYASVLRKRISKHPPPDFFSISRGGGVRLFVAFPVINDNRLWGVIYLSRTPDSVLRQIYATRYRLGSTAAVILSLTLLVAIMASARILQPVYALSEQAREMAKGDWSAMRPLKHYGTRELAVLGEAFLEMASALQSRSTYLKTFATHVSHEFKTPLTSIRGSAELLFDHLDTMKEEERRRFLQNILQDTERLKELVGRLLELARAESLIPLGAVTDLRATVNRLVHTHGVEGLTVVPRGSYALPAAISEENFEIVAINLLHNASEHGATRVDVDCALTATACEIAFRDNGRGISSGNRDKVFEPFFTTRRENGGTGLGLKIVRTLLEAHRGSIELLACESGAAFLIRLPRA